MTSNEIRRLFTKLTMTGCASLAHVMHWSTFRRRRQAQARAAHYRKRANPP